MRARQQPVSCTLVPAAVSGLQEECCGGAKERGLQRIQCAGVVLSCPCCVGALRMICGQPVGRLWLVRETCYVTFNLIMAYVTTTAITNDSTCSGLH